MSQPHSSYRPINRQTVTNPRITFILQSSGRYPSGGNRIIYEHANRLSQKGCRVNLHHVIGLGATSAYDTVRLFARYGRAKYSADRDRAKWHRLDPSITVSYEFWPRPAAVPPGDVVIATAWRTARIVAELPNSCGKKFYFLQSYEDWDGPRHEVDLTWHLPLEKLVISRWLLSIADRMGVRATLIPNAIDLERFFIREPIATRTSARILFPSLPKAIKGSADVVTAIMKLRGKGHSLDVRAFGRVDPRTFGLRGNYTYVENPSQETLREMYNWAGVFVNASRVEGWGLTIAEASACGAALAVSSIGGHREFAEAEVNALMFPPQSPDDIVGQVERLLNDDNLRQALAERANADVARLNWSAATATLQHALGLS